MDHSVAPLWVRLVQRVDAYLLTHGISATRLQVLLPYAQLVEPARQAWAQAHPDGLAPRFETARHWAARLAPWAPAPMDISGDLARDALVAQALLDRVKVRMEPAMRSELVTRLVEAARQLAPVAAAQAPDQRAAWAQQQREALPAGPHWESLLASLALAWVGSSGFETDVLWSDVAAPGLQADGLWLLHGLQRDPLAQALAARWGERAVWSMLNEEIAAQDVGGSTRAFHACIDAQDEAERAAACVIRCVNAGQVPLALVANDRQLTRRVSALLQGGGLRLRDETGWRLSTTHAAARLMALLKAADRRARTDDVLDWLKLSAGAAPEMIGALETGAREQGVGAWAALLKHATLGALVPPDLPPLLVGLQESRPLARWLADLHEALQGCGLWAALQLDLAGQQLVRALRLEPAAAQELRQLGDALAPDGGRQERLSLQAFTGWVRDVLESASFLPEGDADAPVVVLPMPQLLGRSFAAVVVPGCDEVTLEAHPDPGGQWTAAQREQLGLPGRDELARAARLAWQVVLGAPAVDILWRQQDRGEPLSPNPWVMEAMGDAPLAADPRPVRSVEVQAVDRPLPVAPDLVPTALSASAYQDLRDCPYRFFALRMLRLKEVAELEAEPDQREMGNWLHAVLRAFHEERGVRRPGRAADTQRLDELGVEQARRMGLQGEDGEAGFLPFQAVWPALREGYLDWLQTHESDGQRPGPVFERAEVSLQAQVGRWRLRGTLDRIDRQPSPEGDLALVIDYKTEARKTTEDRVKQPFEDTQLAFYAALMPDETLRAAYLSITDGRSAGAGKGAACLIEQSEILRAREQLRIGLAADLDRLAQGQALAALGEGRACEFCAARGLCRRDFWKER